MTSAEKRRKVRDYVFSRERKNNYTQSSKRTQVDNGWSDCSSLQQRAYKEVGIEIGSYTGAQIVKGEWVQLGGNLPDESIMEIGDELFFATNYDNGRPYRVGHIEMYVGNGQISGHGSGVGPTRKNMIDYCNQRNAFGRPFIGVKRYIKNDGSEKDNTGNTDVAETAMFVGVCTGDDVNVRTGPHTNYPNISGWPKLNKGNEVEVLEQVGSWYKIRIAYKHEGYIYASYIAKQVQKTEEVEKEEPISTLNRELKWVGKVTASSLNVRTWAGKENPKIKSWPELAKGNLIDVCDVVKAPNGDDWYYIRIDGRVYGFVSSKYIKKA